MSNVIKFPVPPRIVEPTEDELDAEIRKDIDGIVDTMHGFLSSQFELTMRQRRFLRRYLQVSLEDYEPSIQGFLYECLYDNGDLERPE
ncbi:MAG: hypothetical protein MI745_14135 [Pseudomonadales bacterium]|nr:hypothetical protein [Pseudomonadales bacterium]